MNYRFFGHVAVPALPPALHLFVSRHLDAADAADAASQYSLGSWAVDQLGMATSGAVWAVIAWSTTTVSNGQVQFPTIRGFHWISPYLWELSQLLGLITIVISGYFPMTFALHPCSHNPIRPRRPLGQFHPPRAAERFHIFGLHMGLKAMVSCKIFHNAINQSFEMY